MGYRREAIACVKDHVLPLHKQIYAKYEGTLNDLYEKDIELNTGSTPTLLIGEKSEKVFLFVHGLHGNKEEALAFAEVAVPKGYQALFVSEEVGRDFISRHQCHITIMPDGEHWFHTAKQLAFLKEWEESIVSA